MENIKLIIDSSSNMKSDPDQNVEVVPLTISFGGKDYTDDQNLNIQEFLSDDYGQQHIVDQPSMMAKLPGVENYDSYTRKLTEITTHALTITTKQMRCPNAGVVKLPDGNYRLLTELETWRLMGFDDDDFYAASSVHKSMAGKLNGALYHQAGNSIVVQVLEAIFKELI